MTRIVPISGSAFPHQASRPAKKSPADDKPRAEETRVINPNAHTAANRRISARSGPTTPFLAQYVDQHWPWPRNPVARVQARQDAARAYANTDKRDDKPASGAVTNRRA
ncbi:MAG: hypothetical protein RLN89_00405 [Parvibaculum sp.]